MRKTIGYLGLLLGVLGLSLPMAAQDSEALQTLLEAGDEPVEVGDQLLDETFANSGVWETYEEEDANFRIETGQFRATVDNDEFIWFATNDDLHEDVVMEVETRQRSEHLQNAYGLMCRVGSTGGYYFLVTGDGFYTILVETADGIDNLVEWGVAGDIKTGQSANQITVVCSDDYLALYANGELLTETHDTTYSEGVAGLAVMAFDSGDVDVTFDNLRIWEGTIPRRTLGTSLGLSGSSSTETDEDEPTPTAPESGIPQTLTDHAGEWPEAVSELEAAGFISSGGSLVFQENTAFFSGRGNFFTPLASRSPFTDVIMAGELSFTAGSDSEVETCSLLTRIVTDSQGTATSYLDAGLLNTGVVYIADQFGTGDDDRNDAVAALDLDLDNPHHFLLIALEDRLLLYLDGELMTSDFELQERAGTYGIALRGRGPDARCEGKNIWVYQAPAFTPGVCKISAGNAVNKRSGPGTNFDRAGQLAAGTVLEAVGKNDPGDGFTWWKLEDDTWVRNDVVNAVGDCLNVEAVDP